MSDSPRGDGNTASSRESSAHIPPLGSGPAPTATGCPLIPGPFRGHTSSPRHSFGTPSASAGNTRAVLGTLRNFNVRPPGTPESGHRRRWDSGISGQAPEHFGCVRNAGQQFRRRPINSHWPRRAGLGWKCGWAPSLPDSDGAAGQRRRQNGGA